MTDGVGASIPKTTSAFIIIHCSCLHGRLLLAVHGKLSPHPHSYSSQLHAVVPISILQKTKLALCTLLRLDKGHITLKGQRYNLRLLSAEGQLLLDLIMSPLALACQASLLIKMNQKYLGRL